MGTKHVFISLAAFAVVMFAFSDPAVAANFSADIVQVQMGESMTGKIYVMGHKIRMDMVSPDGDKAITIMDTKSGKMMVLEPEEKICMEMPSVGAAAMHGLTEKSLEQLGERKLLGTETVNGYKCDKYEIILPDDSMGKMILWWSKKLNFPIKIVRPGFPGGDLSFEYKNIREGGLDSSLFEIPSGYETMSMPGMGRGIPKLPKE